MVNTEEVKAQGLGNQSETTSLSPDFQIHIHVCPWHTQFKNMGLPEAGLLYCKDLDASISRALIRTSGMRCPRPSTPTTTVSRSSGTPGSLRKRRSKNICRSKILRVPLRPYLLVPERGLRRDLRGRGVKASDAVLEDFAKEYGREMADTIADYKDTNFNKA